MECVVPSLSLDCYALRIQCHECSADTMDLCVATSPVTISEGPRRAQARLDTFSALRRKGASGYQPLAHEWYEIRGKPSGYRPTGG